MSLLATACGGNITVLSSIRAAVAGLLRCAAVGVPAGAAFAWLGAPLPWLIGPLLVSAALGMGGVALRSPDVARHAGQWVIGAVLGLYFTPAVVAQLLRLAPWLLAGFVWAVGLGLASAWAIRRFARTSVPTAFFAGAVGGASEMAVQGEIAGGRVDQIAAAHSLRILLIVITVPFAFQWLGLQGSDPFEPPSLRVDYVGFAALVALTLAVVEPMRRIGWPNVWVIGPLLATMVLTASGQVWTAMPGMVVIGGQLLIGVSLGSRFTPDFFEQAPRYVTVVALTTLAGIVASAVFGTALGAVAGIAPATMVLATSPGGIAEMSLTARNLALGVPIVTAFHVTRMALLVMTIGPLYRSLAAGLDESRNGRGG